LGDSSKVGFKNFPVYGFVRRLSTYSTTCSKRKEELGRGR